jgi:hypothetical protein
MRNQLFYISIFIISVAGAYTGISWMSQSKETERSSFEAKQDIFESVGGAEGADTVPAAPQDEYVTQAESSQQPRKPFMALPTKEQIHRAAHKGAGGNLRIPVMPIPKE